MSRLLGTLAALVAVPLVASGAAHLPARPSAASSGAALDQDTLVRRCLPQLTRDGNADGSDWTVKPLSTATVVPVKPLLAHHAGDLVAFYGQIQGIDDPGTVSWARLGTLCKVPASEPTGAPGSAPLPASATRPSQGQRTRDLQLCTEAPDVTGFFTEAEYDEHQVVASDVRDAVLAGEAWDGALGVQVLSDPNDGRAFVCSYGIYGSPLVQVVRQSRTIRPFTYLNGYEGGQDQYVAAGVIPSAGDDQRQPATRIAVTPPGRATQTFPVRRSGVAGDGGVGSYAFVMSFEPVTAALGQKHTQVRLLDKAGKVLWSGTWDVGIEGH